MEREASRLEGNVTFAVAALLALPGTIIGSSIQLRFLSLRPIVVYGGMAYAIYLFHPFVGEVIDKVIAPGGESVPLVFARFVAMFVASAVLAWLLKKFIEDPLIIIGRKLAGQKRPPGTVATDPVSTTVTTQ